MKHDPRGTPAKIPAGQEAAAEDETGAARNTTGKNTTGKSSGKGWGQGSASALETLRKSNYKGRRSKPGSDRPDAD